MKRRQLLAILLTMFVLASALAVPASAVSITNNVPATINVNGKNINVKAHMTHDYRIWVKTLEDFSKIFPAECNSTIITYSTSEGICVSDYALVFGYSSSLSYVSSSNGSTTCVYRIYKSAPVSSIPEVYINGLYKRITDMEQFSGIDFSGYNIISSGNRIYLNNDGNSPVEVLLDDKLVHFPDQQPIIIDGRTMVPLRALSELLDCKVDWNQEGFFATISKGNTVLYVSPGNSVYYVNGIAKTMDVTPQLINDRTMVPVRFVAEELGFTVDFSSEGILTVYLYSSN